MRNPLLLIGIAITVALLTFLSEGFIDEGEYTSALITFIINWGLVVVAWKKCMIRRY